MMACEAALTPRYKDDCARATPASRPPGCSALDGGLESARKLRLEASIRVKATVAVRDSTVTVFTNSKAPRRNANTTRPFFWRYCSRGSRMTFAAVFPTVVNGRSTPAPATKWCNWDEVMSRTHDSRAWARKAGKGTPPRPAGGSSTGWSSNSTPLSGKSLRSSNMSPLCTASKFTRRVSKSIFKRAACIDAERRRTPGGGELFNSDGSAAPVSGASLLVAASFS
mmetsp:Transcript_88884/g.177762  ORF Transcript_88884/g.177762 Transcript_88884/m.177762 type:complete len:225 (-) Transcript_88884:2735-3409(-)